MDLSNLFSCTFFFLLSLFNIDLFFIKIKGKKGQGRAGIGSLLEKEGIEEIKWQYVR